VLRSRVHTRAWGPTTAGIAARLGPAPVLLALVVSVVSWHTATNLGGTRAGRLAVVGIFLVVLVVLPAVTALVTRAPRWVLPTLVAVCVALLVAAFVVGVPDRYGFAMGVGSDRADALDVAVTRLGAGLYPYDGVTYLGNPITPLPGALVLAAPFVGLAGDAAWQNVAWTLVLLPVLNGGRRLRPGPTVLWAVAVLAAPEVVREFLIGDDLVTGAVPALAALAWTLTAARARSTGVLVAAAVVLGVVTCTRPHMALVVVVVAVAAGIVAGWRRGVLVGATAGLVWVALIVPFLLVGAARFSPLHVAAKVTGNRGITVGIVVVALAAAALLVIALRLVRPSSTAAVGWFCAAILFAPSLLSVVRYAAGGPSTELDLTLGAAAVPFALWAMCARPAAEATPDPVPDDVEDLDAAPAAVGPPTRPLIAP
jgi:hypothetical protein